jgi:hypothetical protein
LRDLAAAAIVDEIAGAAERWSNADFPARVRATRAVMERTGYSEPVVDYALDRLFESLTGAALRAAIAGELGALEALDGFVPRDGRPAVTFRGVNEVTIVSSDTTIGVAIPPLAYALCAKSHVVVKDRSDGLVAAFVETLAEERRAFAAAVSVETWDGHDASGVRERLGASDVVVAFGGSAALSAIRAALRPDARFVPFGHRTSAGYIAREALAGEEAARTIARGAARDALLYDGEGCLSLHALFVEDGGAVGFARFMTLLDEALAAAEIEFPSGRRELAAATVAARDASRFRESLGFGAVAGGGGHVLLVDPPLDAVAALVPRALAAYRADGPSTAAGFLRRHALPLEGFALAAGGRADVLELAVGSGASQIGPIGTLQSPSLAGEHGGEGRILPFVRAITRSQ